MDKLEKLNADLMGSQIALGTAIRALIKTHPNPEALIAAMHHEHQDTLAHMTNMTIPEQVLEAYYTAWNLVGPKEQD